MSSTLFIGTRRGLFVARSDSARSHWRISEPRLEGREVYHTVADPRDGAVWACTNHRIWGAHVHRSEDGGETWHVLDTAPHFTDERGLRAIWCIAPGLSPDSLLAGIEPAGLFASEDRGASWRSIDELNDHPSRESWQPAGGALALHSIQFDPFDAQRIYCAVSAGGSFRSDDGGVSWRAINDGVRADFLLNRFPDTGQCVHRLIAHPAKQGRLYQQNHCGVYRSDDYGTHWTEITNALPSDFGYVLASDPRNADVLYVVPEESSHMRTTIDGRLRVYRTRDAGATWEPCSNGLPQENAWVSLLRDAMCNDSRVPVGVYFGTSSGHVFFSRDAGDTWALIAQYLPRVMSLSVTDRE